MFSPVDDPTRPEYLMTVVVSLAYLLLFFLQAIKHAVEVWKVDMISMSFGFPTCRIDGYGTLEESINQACVQGTLIFAAASNGGAQHGRAYPARDANVVCVNSVNTNGDRSCFSPTASSGDTSLATVGEAVESAWPAHLCFEGEEAKYSAVKSGTSYATPIMAGIAAFLLTYARLNLSEKAQKLRRRSRMVKLLQRIAQKDDGGMRGGYHSSTFGFIPTACLGRIRGSLTELLRTFWMAEQALMNPYLEIAMD